MFQLPNIAAVFPSPSEASTTQIGVSLFVAASAYGLYSLLKIGSRPKDYPPGPPTVPILGNLPVFPRSRPHFQFTEWAKEYGDVFSVKVMHQTIIVLNTPTALKEIIEKRSTSSINRPASIIADMLTPNGMNFGTGHYADENWKHLRRASVQLLNNENFKKFKSYQHAEATQLMWGFTHDPENWYTHIQRFTTSFALGITYGKRAVRTQSQDCADFLEVQPQFVHALELGTMPPVDLFPILTWVPERFAKWKRTVTRIREMHERLYGRLLNTVEQRIQSGMGNGAFMEEAIKKSKEWNLDSADKMKLMHLGGTILEGSDTSSATLQGVVLVLIAYPRVQEKLREEMDRVVGNDRVPEWDDMPKLTYLQAFIDECARFRPVGPLALPHEMVKDEIVDGIRYPKDAVLFMNLWAITHDERYYDQPDEFIPERFLEHPFGVKAGVTDDPARRTNLLFGGGRRVCPGIAFARTSLEITIANLVWACEFAPALDPDTGLEIKPNMFNYSPGITATPLPFKCRIKPRSPRHVEICERQFAKAAEHLAPYEVEADEEDRKFNRMYRDIL